MDTFLCVHCDDSTAGEIVISCAMCLERYHLFCVDISTEEIMRAYPGRLSWMCSNCVVPERAAPEMENVPEQPVPMEFENENRPDDLHNLDEFVRCLEDMVLLLKYDVIERKQLDFLKDIVIVGVPERRSEDLMQVLLKLGDLLGIAINADDVNYIKRTRSVGAGNQFMPRPIFLQLTTRHLRDAIMQASRCHRGITTDMLDMPGRVNRVYLNERLVKEKRVLFAKTRAVAKDKKFKFAWVKNAQIYLKKSNKASVRHIKFENDLLSVL